MDENPYAHVTTKKIVNTIHKTASFVEQGHISVPDALSKACNEVNDGWRYQPVYRAIRRNLDPCETITLWESFLTPRQKGIALRRIAEQIERADRLDEVPLGELL